MSDYVPSPQELARLAEVQVVVAHDSLAGHSDVPGNLPGVGPVDLDTVREVAGLADLRRLVADSSTGTLLHRDDSVYPPPAAERTGSSPGARPETDPRLARMLADPVTPEALGPEDGRRYRPSARMRLFVQARDATCLGPACSHPATRTQLDHTINHEERDGKGVLGTTTAGNLGSLCDRVHNAKTHGDWHLAQPFPGSFTWTSPTGRTYVRTARPLVPGWRHRANPPPPRPG